MLGHTHRFRVTNSTGTAIAIGDATIMGRLWRQASSGGVEWSSEKTAYSNAGSIAHGADEPGSAVDNSDAAGDGGEWIGGDFEVSLTTTGSPNGDVAIYYQASTDGGTTWPDDGGGVPVWQKTITAAGTVTEQFSL